MQIVSGAGLIQNETDMPNKRIAAAMAALTIASAIVVILGASEEPYLTFRPSQALIQIGIGTALMLLWVQLGCWMLWRVFRRTLGRTWLIGIASGIVVIFYLQGSPIGYVQDLTKFEVCR